MVNVLRGEVLLTPETIAKFFSGGLILVSAKEKENGDYKYKIHTKKVLGCVDTARGFYDIEILDNYPDYRDDGEGVVVYRLEPIAIIKTVDGKGELFDV